MGERILEHRATRASARSSARQVVARHPVATFLITCYAITWAVVLPPLRVQGGLPFGLALWDSLGNLLGVALAAFLVVAASNGRAGVQDLGRRCLRWRVGVRWYLVSLLAMPVAVPLAATAFYGTAPLHNLVDRWPLLLTLLLPRLLVGILLFNLTEEIGWMGFLQDRWQDRYGPLKAALLVTIPFTLYHLPVWFVDDGLAVALVSLPVYAVVHLVARVVMGWLYNTTGRSVLLVGLFHSTFNATVLWANQIVPGPGGTAASLGAGIVLVAAVTLIIVTRGRLSYQPRPVAQPAEMATSGTNGGADSGSRDPDQPTSGPQTVRAGRRTYGGSGP
jgi:membrane protease YdiL (CAAX protease family)